MKSGARLSFQPKPPNDPQSNPKAILEEKDHPRRNNDRNRFDFGDTDFVSGFNFIAGARRPNGLFFELRATAYGVSNVKLLAGYNF